MPVPETPLLTVDCLIRLRGDPHRVVLIQRRNPPHGLALPGGFVDRGERVESAARREAEEETGLQAQLLCLLGVYSDPDRDSRGHTVSCVYIADAAGEPVAADDAAAISIVDPREPGELAFDHATILGDYLRWLATAEVAPLR